MKTNKNIQHKIDDTFDSINKIKEVETPPFFKEKMMKRMFAEEKEEQNVFSWFSPKLQFATLVCVIVLNITAYTQLQTNSYNDNVNSFATSYGLQSDSENSIFN
jgi:hypothetical protein